MGAQARSATLRSYAKNLLAAVVFPVQFVRSWRFADRHQNVDRNARPLMAAAIVVGFVLAAAGGLACWSFQQSATEGIYDSLDGRMARAIGESEYRNQLDTAEANERLIDTAETQIARAMEDGDEEMEATWRANLAEFQEARDEAVLAAAALEGNHQLYLRVSEAVQAQDDAAAKRLIAERPAGVEFDGLEEQAQAAFAVKDDAVADMQWFMTWLVYPGLAGALFAPLVFAESRFLRRGFQPSETVGFKPYPGGAMAIVLLLGAFGVPAIFLASWAFADMRERERLGQIEL